MRPIAVLDSNVVVSGIGWAGESRKVLRLLARRAFISIRTPYLSQEWAETLAERFSEGKLPNSNWEGWLEWLKGRSRLVTEPPAKLIVRRDLKDNPILATAISQSARFLVTHDKDLLTLDKPYGVQCLKPRAFIQAVLATT